MERVEGIEGGERGGGREKENIIEEGERGKRMEKCEVWGRM